MKRSKNYIRQQIYERFARSKKTRVLLLSMKIGAEGLNLQSANNILFTEPHWNPQKEKQAQCRIYRMGQRRDVTFHQSVQRFFTLKLIHKLITFPGFLNKFFV